jgi:cytochrome c oxidase subunit 2
MLFTITAVPPDEFDAWMEAKIEELSQFTPVGTDLSVALPVGDPINGGELYKTMGCASCHSLDGSQLIGPSFKGMASRAATRKPGMAAELYLHESIVSPCEMVVATFTCVMPQDFGTAKLNQQMLSDIIAFLLQQ